MERHQGRQHFGGTTQHNTDASTQASDTCPNGISSNKIIRCSFEGQHICSRLWERWRDKLIANEEVFPRKANHPNLQQPQRYGPAKITMNIAQAGAQIRIMYS